MRLIDADDIPYTMLYKENWMKGTGGEAQGAWKSDIDRMPTIDPVKRGRWITSDLDIDFITCSLCKENRVKMRRAYRKEYAELFKFCPSC